MTSEGVTKAKAGIIRIDHDKGPVDNQYHSWRWPRSYCSIQSEAWLRPAKLHAASCGNCGVLGGCLLPHIYTRVYADQ